MNMFEFQGRCSLRSSRLMLYLLYIFILIANNKYNYNDSILGVDAEQTRDSCNKPYVYHNNPKNKQTFAYKENGAVFIEKEQGVVKSINIDSIDSMDAIGMLHKELDSDQDGVVNQKESGGFLSKVVPNIEIRKTKDKIFHKYDTDVDDDDFISVGELQAAWTLSKVKLWNEADVILWLQKIEMSHIIPIFRAYRIVGKHLPRLALFQGNAIVDMGVSEKDSRRLAAAIAVEILFPGANSLWYHDVIIHYLFPVSSFALCLCLFLYWRSESRFADLAKELDSVNYTLDEAKNQLNHYNSSIGFANNLSSSNSMKVKILLSQIRTHLKEIESSNRIRLEVQLGDAKSQMNKISSRRAGMFGNFVLAHQEDIARLNKLAGATLKEITMTQQRHADLEALFSELESRTISKYFGSHDELFGLENNISNLSSSTISKCFSGDEDSEKKKNALIKINSLNSNINKSNSIISTRLCDESADQKYKQVGRAIFK